MAGTAKRDSWKWWTTVLVVLVCLLANVGGALAGDSVTPGPGGQALPAAPVLQADSGDTAWVLISAALVMFMTPGLAFFYGGLVRKKNMLSILMQCFMILCLISVQWVLFGYSLAFGPDVKGIVGSLGWAGLSGVGLDPGSYAPHVPHQAFMIFQMMFAVITPGLIIGAFAERMKFTGFCVFTLLWATLVYDPVCHWVWGEGGFLRQMGVQDFAGGIVVHINAGLAALAAALVLGRRQGYPKVISPPHNLPFAVIGAAMLWFGWFGFNAGSALGAGKVATNAFVATHTAGAVAGLTWALMEWLLIRRPTMLGMITGCVAGLAAVTPAAGYVNAMGAMAIGVGSGAICYLSVSFVKARLQYDDSLDAFGVHGVGGIWGTLALGIFATKSVNPDSANGLLYGGSSLMLAQLTAVGVTLAYSFVATLLLLKAVNWVTKLRVSEQDERIGLDLTQHREAGYTLID
ncbi:MAG: ammonium transporter [Phycisphaerae bacterium]